MDFLSKILGKKESPITSYNDFWDWFLKHEKEFFRVIQNGDNIEQGFFKKLSPKLDEIHDEIYFLTAPLISSTVVVRRGGLSKKSYIISLNHSGRSL